MPMKYMTPAEAHDILPPKIGPTSYLGNIMTSKDTTPEHTITSGFYKQVAGEPLVFTYTYDEMKVVLDIVGDFKISDEEGTTITPKRGDVLYIKNGATITFSATGEGSYGYFFYTALKTDS